MFVYQELHLNFDEWVQVKPNNFHIGLTYISLEYESFVIPNLLKKMIAIFVRKNNFFLLQEMV
jgi:hypothetical protein